MVEIVALQTLGCIRITPEPVPLSERSPADMTDEEKANQIVSLRVSLFGRFVTRETLTCHDGRRRMMRTVRRSSSLCRRPKPRPKI